MRAWPWKRSTSAWCAASTALIQLLDPPFDKSDLNPGYIKGYVPGVRENGGQYTHAAIWTVMAFAALGDQPARMGTLVNDQSGQSCADRRQTLPLTRSSPTSSPPTSMPLAPHTGRGGWTWYTGSAGWMYRLIVESLLGLRLEVETLRFSPCLPEDWEAFKVHYRYRETFYHIAVSQTLAAGGKVRVRVDGFEQQGAVISLVDDRRHHSVEVTLAAAE